MTFYCTNTEISGCKDVKMDRRVIVMNLTYDDASANANGRKPIIRQGSYLMRSSFLTRMNSFHEDYDIMTTQFAIKH